MNQPKGDLPTVGGAAGRLSTGMMIQHYKIDKQLGRGGMGEVWKAHDTVGDRSVVIKVLPPELQGSQVELARIKETFQRVHGLHHQHICPTYSLGQDGGIGYFLVMKFIDGIELRQYLKDKKKVSFDEMCKLLEPIALALDYSHSQKVIHRDVKTENIMVSRNGTNPQLVDFGVASEIRTSMSRVSNFKMDVSGTRPYMAPEQWKGDYQDGRSDQYALAVVVYELLTGRLPFFSEDSGILRQCVLNDKPAPIAGQSNHVNSTIQKALSKLRDSRFSTCAEFFSAMRQQSNSLSGQKFQKSAPIPPSTKPIPSTEKQSVSGAHKLPNPSTVPPRPPQRPGSWMRKTMRSIERKMNIHSEKRTLFWVGTGSLAFALLILITMYMGGFFNSGRTYNIGTNTRQDYFHLATIVSEGASGTFFKEEIQEHQ